MTPTTATTARGGLLAADVDTHLRLRIPPELLQAAGVCRVTHCEAVDTYGCKLSQPGADMSGIVYPYPDPITGNRVSARVKRDNPERKPDGRPDNKYVSAYGDNRHLYFPPGVGELLKDTTVSVVFVESEKAALALTAWAQRRGVRLLAIATGGCNGWQGPTGKTTGPDGGRVDTRGPLPDFGLLAWTGREVWIAFDSNAVSNPKVQAARGKLAAHLTRLGALVKIATVPPLLGVNGPDDFIGLAGDEPFAGALASAEKYRLDPATASVEELLHLSGVSLLVEGTDLATVEATLYRLGEQMSGAPRLRRAVVRAASISWLKGAKVEGAAALVDAALSATASSDDAQGQQIVLRDPDPWPDSVDGAELLDEIVNLLRQYIVMPDGSPEAVALWAVLTYLIDATDILPMLGITSPDKRCGKSLLLDILAGIVHRHIPAANISPAALFRAVEAYRPCLLIDEADTFLEDNEELRGILNSGHRRSSAYVVRCVGEDLEARQFSTWAPKALAKIGGLPATLEDRAIVVNMKRKAPTESVKRYVERRERARLTELRRRCLRWAKDNTATIQRGDPADLLFLHDRANDNWRPLLAIADTVGGVWTERARESARLLSGVRDDDTQPARVQALIDIRDLFARLDTDRLSSAEIVKELAGMEDRPWSEWKHGNPVTKKQLASLLRPFGLKPTQFKEDGDKTRGYRLADFTDAFSRYIPFAPDESVLPVPSASSGCFQPKTQSVPVCSGTGSQIAEDPCPVGKVPMVPDRKGDIGLVCEVEGVL
jgi:hypothetical protein